VRTVTIRSSNRVVPIFVEGDSFYVIRPSTGHDGCWRAAGYHAVAGPFPLTDPRFIAPELPCPRRNHPARV